MQQAHKSSPTIRYLNFGKPMLLAEKHEASTKVQLPSPGFTPRQITAKRVFDLVACTAGFAVLLPLLALIAVAIKVTSSGPVLFKQDRVGQNGKIFKIYKFRSMVNDAEKLQYTVNEVTENGTTLHKHRNDPRVTLVGKVIRKTSLDELPQLLNVIKGDMSLVGPRPEMPWVVEDYEPWQHRRFEVPQGMTGWWQINGRSDKPCHLNTDQDVYYIDNYSFWLDIQILIKTIPALLRGKGAF